MINKVGKMFVFSGLIAGILSVSENFNTIKLIDKLI